MGILSWVVLGLIAGWLANYIIPTGSLGLIKTLILGVVGALLGGYISTFFGWGSVSGINFSSIIIAVLGAVIILVIFRMIRKS